MIQGMMDSPTHSQMLDVVDCSMVITAAIYIVVCPFCASLLSRHLSRPPCLGTLRLQAVL